MSVCPIFFAQTVFALRNSQIWCCSLLTGGRRFVSVDSRHFIQGTAREIQLSRTVQLARRKYLPGSFERGFPEQLASPREGFPIVLKTKDNAELKGRSVGFWAECFREQISLLYEDFATSDCAPVAVLVRGLPIQSTKEFSEFVKGLGFEFFAYQGGGGIRDQVDDFVLTGAGEPKEYSVELHNDMSYSVDYPSKFMITCLKKSEFGGETAICNGRELTANLESRLVEKFENKGIRYLRYVLDKCEGSFNSWQRSLLTEDRAEAERFLAESGYSFAWDDKNLVYWNDVSPTIVHPLSGEKLWFNQAYMSHCTYFKAMPMYEGSNLPDKKYPSHTVHADGEDIELDDLHKVRCTAWNTAVGISLEETDVLFLDNLAVLHSRLSYEGERVVRTSILK